VWGGIRRTAMADLMKEYIDTKDIRHKVEHQVVSTDDRKSAEQIVEELFHVLTKRRGRPASV
jgi:hypothetical protein